MSLPLLVRWGYAVGHILNDLCSAMWFTYMLIFFQTVVGLSAAKSGLIVLIGQVADAIATPVIGIWSDRGTLYCLDRLGKRRAWYIVGCEKAPETMQVLYYSVFVILFQCGWAAVQTVHLALASDLMLLALERTILLSLRNTFTVLCNIIVYVMAFVMIEAIDKTSRLSSRDLYKFQIIITSILGVGLTASLFFILTVKEDRDLLESTQPLLNRVQFGQARASLASILKRRSTYLVSIVYTSTRLFMNNTQVLMPLYLHETLNLKAYFIAVIPLVMYIAGFVSSIMCGYLSRRIGKKASFFISSILVDVASFSMFLGDGSMYETYFLYIISLVYGGAGSILIVTALSIISDFIGTDVGNSAFVYGTMSFTDKLSSGLTIMAVQYFKPSGTSMYYRDALVGIAAGSVTVAAIGVFFKPRDHNVEFTRSIGGLNAIA